MIIVLREVFSARQHIIKVGLDYAMPFRPSLCPSDGCIIEKWLKFGLGYGIFTIQ